MYEDLNGFSFVYLDKSKPGAILREQRVTQNMTQRQVAEKAKITIRQYQTFESNQRNLRTASFLLACRVLDALNMNIDDFYHGGYCIGEETYMAEDGRFHYVKTGRAVDEDVTEEDETED